MAVFCRQSTAIIVTVGPVLDADGVAVTDGVVGDFLISKNGAAPAALNGSATLTHRNTGHYSLSLTATDVNTVGTVEIVINDLTNACPIKEITVVETTIYDALFADTANGFAGAVGASTVTFSNASIATVTTLTNLPAITANWLTAAGTAADFGTEVAGAVWDLDATGHQTQGTFGQAIGDPAADTNTIYKAVVTDATGATVGVDVAAVLDDTGTAGVVVASLAAGSITAATIATGAIDADALSADAGTEIGTAVWATAARTVTAATNITSTGGAIDLTAGGTVGIDWGNIENTGTTVLLTSTRVEEVTSVLGNVFGSVSGNVVGSVGSVTTGGITSGTFAAGAINAAAIAADAIGASELAADAIAEIQSGLATAVNLATVDTVVDAIKLKTDLLPEAPAKNTAFTYVVKMVDSTDGFTPETGLTITMTRSLDGAAFGAATGAVTEISTGHYKVDASAADMNGDIVTHRFTAAGAARRRCFRDSRDRSAGFRSLPPHRPLPGQRAGLYRRGKTS